jgi:hypothetical protein
VSWEEERKEHLRKIESMALQSDLGVLGENLARRLACGESPEDATTWFIIEVIKADQPLESYTPFERAVFEFWERGAEEWQKRRWN